MEVTNRLLLNACFSLVGFYATLKIIPRMKEMFIKAHMSGVDLCKKDRQLLPESQGVVAGSVYLIIMFIFIPVQFANIQSSFHWASSDSLVVTNQTTTIYNFRQNIIEYELFVQFMAALLSICCMLFLGFADDVLDLRWLTKLILPMLASLPLLMVYAITYNNTTIIVPKPFRSLLGFSLDLSFFYYIFLAMLAIFCTNAINIVAGINGIEASQGLFISVSILAYNTVELLRSTDHTSSHIFSIQLMLPFSAVTSGLLYHNFYPAQVFVGDTYCYFAGMTFAVVGILGHFSKTMLLFFIPQVFNFLYSCPQLFYFVDCPRHRLPRYNAKDDLLYPSVFIVDTNKVGLLGATMIRILRLLHLIQYRQLEANKFECSNLTIINLMIHIFGPRTERSLTLLLIKIQILCSLLAFSIRYGLSQLFY